MKIFDVFVSKYIMRCINNDLRLTILRTQKAVSNFYLKGANHIFA